MSIDGARVGGLAETLRDEFDHAFKGAPTDGVVALVDLLAIGVGGDPYVLRLTELSGLFANKTVTWLPSPVAALLGIAGFRGTVLPVFDLGMLLGKPKAAAPRWLALSAAAPVALAFETFHGFVRARSEAIVSDTREGRGRQVRELLQGEMTRPIIDVPSVLAAIANGGVPNGPGE